MTLVSITLLLHTLLVIVSGSTDTDAHRVWRRKELRFTGFRFEIVTSSQEFDFKSLIQSRAENHFCFGWVQDSPRGTLVGECRCKKDAGKKMIDFITALSSDESNIRVYEDSLIRLHPSSFKVIPETRNTCFREEPHKCKHLYFQGEDGTAFYDR